MGEDEPILTHIFQMGLKPPSSGGFVWLVKDPPPNVTPHPEIKALLYKHLFLGGVC